MAAIDCLPTLTNFDLVALQNMASTEQVLNDFLVNELQSYQPHRQTKI